MQKAGSERHGALQLPLAGVFPGATRDYRSLDRFGDYGRHCQMGPPPSLRVLAAPAMPASRIILGFFLALAGRSLYFASCGGRKFTEVSHICPANRSWNELPLKRPFLQTEIVP